MGVGADGGRRNIYARVESVNNEGAGVVKINKGRE